MAMPSETAIVVKMRAAAPASWAPRWASSASWSRCALQGVTWFQELAMPTIGFEKSASSRPTARR